MVSANGRHSTREPVLERDLRLPTKDGGGPCNIETAFPKVSWSGWLHSACAVAAQSNVWVAHF